MVNRKNKGFTLIELLVVISIIGVLSSTILSSVQQARIKANNAQKNSMMLNFEKAFLMALAEGRDLPLGDGCIGGTNQSCGTSWGGGTYNRNRVPALDQFINEFYPNAPSFPPVKISTDFGGGTSIAPYGGCDGQLNGKCNHFYFIYHLEGQNGKCTGNAFALNIYDVSTFCLLQIINDLNT